MQAPVGEIDLVGLESALERRVGPVLCFRSAEQHVQEISRIAQIIVGVDVGHAQSVPVGEGRNGGHFADEAVGLFLARLGTEDVFGVAIESGERGDRRNGHPHRMGVVMKAVEKLLDALVNKSVMRDVIGPVFQLGSRGQFAIQQQISGFQVGAFFREILDGIAAITQDSDIAINVRDSADAGSRVVEGRVVAHHPEFFRIDLDLPKIGGADGAVSDGDFVGFTRAIIGNRKGLAGGAGAVRLPRLCCGEWRAHSMCLEGSGAVALHLSLTLYTKAGGAETWTE